MRCVPRDTANPSTIGKPLWCVVPSSQASACCPTAHRSGELVLQLLRAQQRLRDEVKAKVHARCELESLSWFALKLLCCRPRQESASTPTALALALAAVPVAMQHCAFDEAAARALLVSNTRLLASSLACGFALLTCLCLAIIG